MELSPGSLGRAGRVINIYKVKKKKYYRQKIFYFLLIFSRYSYDLNSRLFRVRFKNGLVIGWTILKTALVIRYLLVIPNRDFLSGAF